MLLPNSNQPPQQAGGESESWKLWISNWQMLRYPQWQKAHPNSAASLLPTNMGNIKWPFFWVSMAAISITSATSKFENNPTFTSNVGLIGWIYRDFLFSWILFQRCFFFCCAIGSVRQVCVSAELSPARWKIPGISEANRLPYKQPWKFAVCSMKKSFYIWKEQGGRTMWNIGVKANMWSSQNRGQNSVWNHTAINNPRLVSHLNNGGSTSDLVDSLDQKGTMPGRHSAIPDPTTRAVGLRNMMVKFIVSSINRYSTSNLIHFKFQTTTASVAIKKSGKHDIYGRTFFTHYP